VKSGHFISFFRRVPNRKEKNIKGKKKRSSTSSHLPTSLPVIHQLRGEGKILKERKKTPPRRFPSIENERGHALVLCSRSEKERKKAAGEKGRGSNTRSPPASSLSTRYLPDGREGKRKFEKRGREARGEIVRR